MNQKPHCEQDAKDKCSACAYYWLPHVQALFRMSDEERMERLLAPLRALGLEIDATYNGPSGVVLTYDPK